MVNIVKARKLLTMLYRNNWSLKRQTGGSHKIFEKEGYQNYSFSFHENEDIGHRMLAKISKDTGLKFKK